MCKYICKEDPNPLRDGTLVKYATAEYKFLGRENAKEGKLDCIMKAVMKDNVDILDLFEQMPGTMAMHYPKIKTAQQIIVSLKEQKKKNTKPTFSYTGTHPQTRAIVNWLNHNLYGQMKFKAKQLYLIAPADSGKTTLLNMLEKFLNMYHIPSGEDFYDLYKDGVYELAVLDEFKGQKPVQWLNLWLQGGKMNIRQKGAQMLKAQPFPTIICSNFTLEENYNKMLSSGQNHQEKIVGLKERLWIIKLDSYLDITQVTVTHKDGTSEPLCSKAELDSLKDDFDLWEGTKEPEYVSDFFAKVPVAADAVPDLMDVHADPINRPSTPPDTRFDDVLPSRAQRARMVLNPDN